MKTIQELANDLGECKSNIKKCAIKKRCYHHLMTHADFKMILPKFKAQCVLLQMWRNQYREITEKIRDRLPKYKEN